MKAYIIIVLAFLLSCSNTPSERSSSVSEPFLREDILYSDSEAELMKAKICEIKYPCSYDDACQVLGFDHRRFLASLGGYRGDVKSEWLQISKSYKLLFRWRLRFMGNMSIDEVEKKFEHIHDAIVGQDLFEVSIFK
jgi:hypothetical protein